MMARCTTVLALAVSSSLHCPHVSDTTEVTATAQDTSCFYDCPSSDASYLDNIDWCDVFADEDDLENYGGMPGVPSASAESESCDDAALVSHMPGVASGLAAQHLCVLPDW